MRASSLDCSANASMAAILSRARPLPCATSRRRSDNQSVCSAVACASDACSAVGQFHLEPCQFAQRRDLRVAGQVAEPGRRGRKRYPRGEKRQVIERAPALPGQRQRPPRGFALGNRSGVAGQFRGGAAEPIEAHPRGCECGWRGSACGLQLLLKWSEPGPCRCLRQRPAESRTYRSSPRTLVRPGSCHRGAHSRPGAKVNRWPARFPLSTVEM